MSEVFHIMLLWNMSEKNRHIYVIYLKKCKTFADPFNKFQLARVFQKQILWSINELKTHLMQFFEWMKFFISCSCKTFLKKIDTSTLFSLKNAKHSPTRSPILWSTNQLQRNVIKFIELTNFSISCSCRKILKINCLFLWLSLLKAVFI